MTQGGNKKSVQLLDDAHVFDCLVNGEVVFEMQISLEVIGLCLDQLDQDFQHLLKYHGFVDLQDTGDLSKVC